MLGSELTRVHPDTHTFRISAGEAFRSYAKGIIEKNSSIVKWCIPSLRIEATGGV